jgi:hypothetical protein
LSQALFGSVPFDVIRIRELIKAVADEVMPFAQIAHCKGLPQRGQVPLLSGCCCSTNPLKECTGFVTVCVYICGVIR